MYRNQEFVPSHSNGNNNSNINKMGNGRWKMNIRNETRKMKTDSQAQHHCRMTQALLRCVTPLPILSAGDGRNRRLGAAGAEKVKIPESTQVQQNHRKRIPVDRSEENQGSGEITKKNKAPRKHYTLRGGYRI